MNRQRAAVLLVTLAGIAGIASIAGIGFAAAPAWAQAGPTLEPRIVVQTTPNFLSSPPEVAFSPAGSYLAVWNDVDASRRPQIYGRLLDAAGALSGVVFQINPADSFGVNPRVAANGAGFAVAWTEEGVLLRRYDAHGTPLGDPVQIEPPELAANCDVALNAAGDALVVWTTNMPQFFVGYRVFARIVSHDGTLSAIKPLTPDRFTTPTAVRAAAAPDGSFLALWQQIADAVPTTLQAQKVDAAGNWAPPFQVDEAAYPSDLGARPLFRPDGSFAILWKSLFFLPSEPTMVREFDAAGTPRTHEIQLAVLAVEGFDAALDPGGNMLVFTADSGLGAQGFLFDRSWNPVTSVTFLARDDAGFQTQPSLAADLRGAFFALWSVAPKVLDPPDTPGLIVGQRLDPIPCIVGSPVLCMGPNQRFQARVAWTNPNTGETGVGHSLPLTADTGAFWFFGDQNLELMAKVLDGTAINLRYWLYAGSLSNVDYTLTVTDTLTGVVRPYHNPAGQFSSLADVTAFPFGLSAAAETAEMETVGAKADPLVGCLSVAADPTSLCLSSGHFTVSVQFTDPRTGLAGAARAVPLTGDTGAFWFFDDSNLELMIKVLDGRAVNGKFWVFYGALSDVDFRVTVTRPETGEVRTYHNPRGTLASHADTQAF